MSLDQEITSIWKSIYHPLDLSAVQQSDEKTAIKLSAGSWILNLLGQSTDPRTGTLLVHAKYEKKDKLARKQSADNVLSNLFGLRPTKKPADLAKKSKKDRTGQPSVVQAVFGTRAGATGGEIVGNIADRLKALPQFVWNVVFGLGFRLPLNIIKLPIAIVKTIGAASFTLARAANPIERSRWEHIKQRPFVHGPVNVLVGIVALVAMSVAMVAKAVGFVAFAIAAPIDSAQLVWDWTCSGKKDAEGNDLPRTTREKILGGFAVALSVLTSLTAYVGIPVLLFTVALPFLPFGIGATLAGLGASATGLVAGFPAVLAGLQTVATLIGISVPAVLAGIAGGVALIAGSAASMISDQVNRAWARDKRFGPSAYGHTQQEAIDEKVIAGSTKGIIEKGKVVGASLVAAVTSDESKDESKLSTVKLHWGHFKLAFWNDVRGAGKVLTAVQEAFTSKSSKSL